MKPSASASRPGNAPLWQAVALALLLTAAPGAYAQSKGPMRLVLKAALASAGLAGSAVPQAAGPDYTTRQDARYLGFGVGAALRVPVSRQGAVAVQPEVLLSQRGYKLQADQTAGMAAGVAKRTYEQTRGLTYLDVPLLANIGLGGWYLEAGPQLSLLLRAHSETRTTTSYVTAAPDQEATASASSTADLARFDVGVVGGVGYQSACGLGLGLRLSRGLRPLLAPPGSTDRLGVYPDALQLQVSYALPAHHSLP
ncbi:PorT family protein [Hymenobacter sp. 5317J-9]|uniref:porin family protein n=1 Tax=Hymenobacter sp. 5317J-9 TaxID=2932250 RepID=UPI001FD6A4C6|nr:porin family protein [Hymenobacter sp. 5317J-9]UOQ96474.1 PorT family protein [Hymenobacter sp. 5317J-9]